jgi:hypothetical protein
MCAAYILNEERKGTERNRVGGTLEDEGREDDAGKEKA